MLRLTFCSAVVFFVLWSCSDERKIRTRSGTVKRSFYYWQTSLHSFNWNDSLYKTMEPEKIYLRFFDVDWSEEVKAPMPVGILQWGYPTEVKSEIVPVVFITNETFKNIASDDIPSLARNVYRRVTRHLNTFIVDSRMDEVYSGGWYEPSPYQMKSKNFDEQRKYDSTFAAQASIIKEIQFDCDWTKSTKEKYFAFLNEVTKHFNDKQITSTIRLYQYKYPREAGLPPVKRAMLMCYNAGDVRDKDGPNSIFNKDDVMEYLDADEYPIPLDYALPVFQWALLFHDGKLKTILPAEVITNPNVEKIKDDLYRVNNDYVLGYDYNGTYIRRGDEIKLERPSLQDVKEVGEWLSGHKNNPDASLVLYHLNNIYLEMHHHEMEDIFASF